MADTNRDELHALVDHLADVDVPTVKKLLRALADPVRLSIALAQFDDEPESEEERAEVEAARSESGPGTPHEEVLREFGL